MSDPSTNTAGNAGDVRCPSCDTGIACFDSGNCTFFCCPACSLFFDTSSGWKEKRKATLHDPLELTTNLPRGASGKFDDAVWRVQGQLVKRELDEGDYIYWREYLLYNPVQGYATAVEFDGHWMFVKPVGERPAVCPRPGNKFTAVYEGKEFALSHNYRFEIASAAGAFDENILSYENMVTREFVSVPEMLIDELLAGNSQWYIGRYVTPEEVAEAFDIPRSGLPQRKGIGIIQPSAYPERAKKMRKIAFLFTILVLMVVLFTSFTKQDGVLLTASYTATGDSTGSFTGSPVITQSFQIAHQTGVEFVFHTPLQNQWMELSFSLINDNTGARYDFIKSLDRYTGYEDGESWSEGSEEESAFLSAIPEGTYHVNIYPYTSAPGNHLLSLKIQARSSVRSNVILMLLVILIAPLGNFLLHKQFEQARLA